MYKVIYELKPTKRSCPQCGRKNVHELVGNYEEWYNLTHEPFADCIHAYTAKTGHPVLHEYGCTGCVDLR